ncbi:MAG: dihydrodipicolinate synthase family protein [Lacrimispora sp.]|uniref:dihydrodipicolinate synthase family protein n=1 Tax=Lacrimispora sp. TaxID=2719234 RepID=UPI0039E5E857
MKKLYVASITPFDREGKINEAAIRQLWEKNISQGADGFFIGGSSGECFLLTREERVRSFELASEYKDRTDIFAHVGAISTEEAVFYAKEAKEMGIPHIAATPPIYFGFSEKEIAGYYYDIAEAVGHSVLYYNIPSSTHKYLNLSSPEIQALLKSGAVGSVKHTNLDLLQMERMHNINPDIVCYGGFESCMVAFLAFGCEGFIGSSFNFMLPQYKRVMELYLEGRGEEARVLQSKSNNILDVLLKNGLCANLKHVVSRQGIWAGDVRKPLLPLTEDQKAEMDQVLEQYLEIC